MSTIETCVSLAVALRYAIEDRGVEVGRPDAESGVDGEFPTDPGDEPVRREAVDAEQSDVVVLG